MRNEPSGVPGAGVVVQPAGGRRRWLAPARIAAQYSFGGGVGRAHGLDSHPQAPAGGGVGAGASGRPGVASIQRVRPPKSGRHAPRRAGRAGRT